MNRAAFYLLFIATLVFGTAAGCFGQSSADGRSPLIPGEEREEMPRSFRENMEKMRIEREKKDHEQMLERGEQTVKITEDLEKAFTADGKLSEKQREQIAQVEKLAKQIRGDLGGSDDDQDDPPLKTGALQDVIKSLSDSSQKLYDELKKTTRFSISAAAIQSSNSLLKIARYLKGLN